MVNEQDLATSHIDTCSVVDKNSSFINGNGSSIDYLNFSTNIKDIVIPKIEPIINSIGSFSTNSITLFIASINNTAPYQLNDLLYYYFVSTLLGWPYGFYSGNNNNFTHKVLLIQILEYSTASYPFYGFGVQEGINITILPFECSTLQVIPNQKPTLLSFSTFGGISTIDVGGSYRTISFNFLIDSSSTIKLDQLPIVYINSLFNGLVQCFSKIVSIGTNSIFYTCSTELPLGFGYPNPLIFSIYGILYTVDSLNQLLLDCNFIIFISNQLSSFYITQTQKPSISNLNSITTTTDTTTIIYGDNEFSFIKNFNNKGGKGITISSIQQFNELIEKSKTTTITLNSDNINYLSASVMGAYRYFDEFSQLNLFNIDFDQISINNGDQLQKTIQLLLDSNQFIQKEFIIRNNQVYYERYKRELNLNNSFKSKSFLNEKDRLFAKLSPNLEYILNSKKPLNDDEIEVEVKATGINYKDYLIYCGLVPAESINHNGDINNPEFGIEYSGIISRIGNDVTNFKIGDQVYGMGKDTISTHVIVDSRLCYRKPTNISYQEAASIPCVYLTSLCSIFNVRSFNIKGNESILIRSGTGGVGLSALNLLKWKGHKSHVFVTNCGFISHPLNHNEYTNNNHFKFNYGYHNFELTFCNKFLIQKSLKKITIGIEGGELKLIPITAYSNLDVKEAIEYINKRKHIGKIVLNNDIDILDQLFKNQQNERNSNFSILKSNYQINKDHLGSNILVTGQSFINEMGIRPIQSAGLVSRNKSIEQLLDGRGLAPLSINMILGTLDLQIQNVDKSTNLMVSPFNFNNFFETYKNHTMIHKFDFITNLLENNKSTAIKLNQYGSDSLLIIQLKNLIDKDIFPNLITIQQLQTNTISMSIRIISDQFKLKTGGRYLGSCNSPKKIERNDTSPNQSSLPTYEFWDNETKLYDEFNSIIQTTSNVNNQTLFKDNEKRVLLTGSTGFLGVYLLWHLLQMENRTIVYCIIRNKNLNNNPINEILNNLKHYQLYDKQLNEGHLSKIAVIMGDLSKKNLGLTENDYSLISNDTNLLLNCGADINLSSNYEGCKQVNVIGTKEMVKLSLLGNMQQPKPIVSISTFSVFYNQPLNQGFDESIVLPKLETINDYPAGYIQSKVISEIILTRASSKFNIPSVIIRAPSIFSNPDTGIGHSADLFQLMLQVSYKLGYFPCDKETDFNLVCSPITWVADNTTKMIFNDNSISNSNNH
ncbi:hypothetical protein ACTA71_008340 [Dictyostelium dimigraforme]